MLEYPYTQYYWEETLLLSPFYARTPTFKVNRRKERPFFNNNSIEITQYKVEPQCNKTGQWMHWQLCGQLPCRSWNIHILTKLCHISFHRTTSNKSWQVLVISLLLFGPVFLFVLFLCHHQYSSAHKNSFVYLLAQSALFALLYLFAYFYSFMIVLIFYSISFLTSILLVF